MSDEFKHGIWWVQHEAEGWLRSANLGECAKEIQRLRAELANARKNALEEAVRIAESQRRGNPPGNARISARYIEEEIRKLIEGDPTIQTAESVPASSAEEGA
jgi:hypothetical protein